MAKLGHAIPKVRPVSRFQSKLAFWHRTLQAPTSMIEGTLQQVKPILAPQPPHQSHGLLPISPSLHEISSVRLYAPASRAGKRGATARQLVYWDFLTNTNWTSPSRLTIRIYNTRLPDVTCIDINVLWIFIHMTTYDLTLVSPSQTPSPLSLSNISSSSNLDEVTGWHLDVRLFMGSH